MNRFRTFILTAILMLSFASVIAQKADYTTNSGLILGIGWGKTNQQSDLANSDGSGFDFTLGSEILQRDDAFIGVDWKFHFLAGNNKAYDHRINADNTYSNILYSFNTYDLELGLFLNRLREKTGIILGGFAGAGITQGQTFADLYDAGNNLYDYSGIDPTLDRKLVYEDLVALSDGDFETELEKNAALLPTAGLFAGYQVSKALSLGIALKTTLSLSEQSSFTGMNMDNRIFEGSGMDRNRYLNVRFRWAFGSGFQDSGGKGSNFSSAIDQNSGNTDQPVVGNPVMPPAVAISKPTGERIQTTSANQSVEATITNIDGPAQVNFTRNGYPVNDFVYNPATEKFFASVRLREGKNRYRIKATNQASVAEDEVIIILEKQEVREVKKASPYIAFTDPVSRQITTGEEIMRITAFARNISRKSEIKLTRNGNLIPFAFSAESGQVNAEVKLNPGKNNLIIRGKNEAGNSEDALLVSYIIPDQTTLPVIRFTNPPNPVTVENMRFPLEAVIQHVEGPQDVILKLNGNIKSFNSHISF